MNAPLVSQRSDEKCAIIYKIKYSYNNFIQIILLTTPIGEEKRLHVECWVYDKYQQQPLSWQT